MCGIIAWHTSEGVLRRLHKHVKDFVPLKGDFNVCHPCRLGKATRKGFTSAFESVNYTGEVVHFDLAGPLSASMDGAQYVYTFTDQFSRFTHVIGLRKKSDTVAATEEYKKQSHVTKYFKKGVERLHSDGGGEYEGVSVPEHTTTTPHTPQHNPFAERVNRTLFEPVRVLLEQAGLSARYWEYAIDYVSYIKNRFPHASVGKSPFEKLTEKKPTLHYARPFACAAFIYEHSPASKVHSRAAPAILLGCNDHGVYTVECLKDGKIVNSVHVNFDEQNFPGLDNDASESSDGQSDYSDIANESESESEAFAET